MIGAGYLIRPARPDDLEGMFALSSLAGTGFTSLQPDYEFLAAMIEKSVRSFQGTRSPNDNGLLLLVMQEAATGELAGCCSIKLNVGGDEFKCADFQALSSTDRPTSYDANVKSLRLLRTIEGYTEVGSLFLHPDHRSTGAGRFLAQARYMLMATDMRMRGRPIVAQLRGVCDATGASPFYSAVWEERLGMSYGASDVRLAEEGAGFLLDRFAGLEVDVSRLPRAAAATIGQPHQSAAGALRLLLQEGFEPSNLVDLADGGPIVLGRLSSLRSVKSAPTVRPISSQMSGDNAIGMIARHAFESFLAYVGPVRVRPGAVGEVECPGAAAGALAGNGTYEFRLSPSVRRRAPAGIEHATARIEAASDV